MRKQSTVQLHIRGLILGGPRPAVCLPLVGGTRHKVAEEARALTALQPDLLEWRIDGFEQVENIDACLSLLKEMRTIIGDIPLIFTCRIDQEGGMQPISPEKRLELVCAAMKTGDVDILDIELCNPREFIDTVRKQAAESGVKLILSYHNFTETPSEAFICSKLAVAQEAGADIVKLAAMPHDQDDVLTLLRATLRARNEIIAGPIVTMSMGTPGVLSRLAGGLYGSDVTFAVGMGVSAPGQIPIGELKKGMALLYND